MRTKPRRRRKIGLVRPLLCLLLAALFLQLWQGRQQEPIPPELLELKQHNSEAAAFVEDYPKYHNRQMNIDLTNEASQESVPLLLQWDTRWGYERYGSGMMACTGCGPTCLSMAVLHLTQDASATPLAIAAYAEENGFYTPGYGTNWNLMSEGSAYFGLVAEELPLTEQRMRDALSDGALIVCVMGPGDFTTTGHFILLTGCTEKGFTLHDPNSPKRSEEIWTYETLEGQIRNLWALRAA